MSAWAARADHRLEIDVRRAHGGVVGPDVAAAGVVDERRDVRPAAGDHPCAAGAAPGHHQRPRRLRHCAVRARTERPIARLHRVVERRRLPLFVHEQRDVLQPLGARERGRLEPLGVGDDRNAGAADRGQRRIAAGAHEHRRPAGDDELGVDDAGRRELADGAGRGTALHARRRRDRGGATRRSAPPAASRSTSGITCVVEPANTDVAGTWTTCAPARSPASAGAGVPHCTST